MSLLILSCPVDFFRDGYDEMGATLAKTRNKTMVAIIYRYCDKNIEGV